jgi:uncharacterized protein with HEPN domain
LPDSESLSSRSRTGTPNRIESIHAELRSQHGAIPWLDISGMRNRLIHAYFDIDLDVVWTTVSKDLPLLKTELEKIV